MSADLRSLVTAGVCAGALGFLLGRASAPADAALVPVLVGAPAPVNEIRPADESKAEKLMSRRPETKANAPLNPNTLAKKMSLKDVNWDGKRVLVRVDYNCPIKNGVVTDATRIESTLPTLQHLLSAGKPKAIVLIAHLGQPVGAFNRADYTLAPCASKLQVRWCAHHLNPVRSLKCTSTRCV